MLYNMYSIHEGSIVAGTHCWRCVWHLCMYKVMTALVADEVAMEVTATQAGGPMKWVGHCRFGHVGYASQRPLRLERKSVYAREAAWYSGCLQRVQDKVSCITAVKVA